jgi:CDP-diacylglycerol--glycerol-3-phosphate 3-phosphatidyltransferase
VTGWALGAALVVIVALALATAHRPACVAGADEHLDGWQALHGGVDPRSSVWVSGYLRGVRLLARPLAARGVAPDAVTALAVWASAAVLVAARADLLVLAAALLVLSALLDGVDGAVAVLADRATARGRVLDAAADRVCEALWLAAAVVAGCPVWLALLAGLVIACLEGVRLVLGRVVRVTAAERPTRVLALAPALLPVGEDWTTALVAVLVGVTLGGLTQLALAVRRPLLR